MSEAPFIDLYDLLEVSAKASPEVIETTFRAIAKRWHPESGTSPDADKFKLAGMAYQTLRDTARRQAYDKLYQKNKKDSAEINQGTQAISKDYAIRNHMLEIFYAQRRRDMKAPGVGIAKLEELLKIPTETIEFHLWYFREKGWVQRETAGPLSITVAGVDVIESREQRRAEVQSGKSEFPTVNITAMTAGSLAAGV